MQVDGIGGETISSFSIIFFHSSAVAVISLATENFVLSTRLFSEICLRFWLPCSAPFVENHFAVRPLSFHPAARLLVTPNQSRVNCPKGRTCRHSNAFLMILTMILTMILRPFSFRDIATYYQASTPCKGFQTKKLVSSLDPVRGGDQWDWVSKFKGVRLSSTGITHHSNDECLKITLDNTSLWLTKTEVPSC